MSTLSLALKTFRFSKTAIAITVLAVGFGMHEASAALLTPAQAKAAANLVSGSRLGNTGFSTVRDLTANTGAEFAALNARLLASYVDGNNISALVSIINGLSYNYPNQQAAIVAQVLSLNEKTRGNSTRIIAALGSSLSPDAAVQLSATLSPALLKDGFSPKKAGLLSFTLLTAISNSSVGTPEERANQVAIAAANLASNLLVPSKNGSYSKNSLTAFTQIAYVVATLSRTMDTGSLTRDQLVNNVVYYFTSTLKQSTTAGALTSVQVAVTLARAQAILGMLMPNEAAMINKIISDVMANNGGSGPITPSETPH